MLALAILDAALVPVVDGIDNERIVAAQTGGNHADKLELLLGRHGDLALVSGIRRLGRNDIGLDLRLVSVDSKLDFLVLGRHE